MKIIKYLFQKKKDPIDANPVTNGEYKLIADVCNEWSKKETNRKFILFDVGANVGSYTENAISEFEKKNIEFEIHLFEPQRHCYDVLKEKFSGYKNVKPNNFGLASFTQYSDIYKQEEGSSGASVFKREVFEELYQMEKVEMLSAEEYLGRTNLKDINFLKVDTEGSELDVLKGFGKLLDERVKYIQFEYGGTYKDANIKLEDVYKLLTPDFRIGKVSFGGVNYKKYSHRMEDYRYSNFLAENLKC